MTFPILSFTRRLSPVPLLVVLSAPGLAQTTWWVDVTGTPPGSGTSSDPFTEIGYALAQPTTVDGDTIQVRPGVYFERDIDTLGKAVRVVSTAGPLETVVDAGLAGTCVVIRSGEGPGTVLEGLTLRRGSGTPIPWNGGTIDAGGGLVIQGASPTVVDCRIRDHTSLSQYPELGGGAYLEDSQAHFVGCELLDNSSGFAGGAGVAIVGGAPTFEGCSFVGNGGLDLPALSHPLYGGAVRSENALPEFVGCLFRENLSAWGGAIYGAAVATSCTFEGNFGQFGGAVAGSDTGVRPRLVGCELRGNFGFGYTGECGFGGAAYGAVLEGCVVVDNSACRGGGVDGCEVVDSVIAGNSTGDVDGSAGAGLGGGAAGSNLLRCVVYGNSVDDPLFAPGMGGGVAGSPYGFSVTAERCVIFDNEASLGGGAQGVTLVHCTLWGNRSELDGDGAYGCTLDSCIVWNHARSLAGGSTAMYSDVEGGAPGPGNFALDPLLVDPDAGQMQLLPGSPCVDTGNPLSAPDLDGSPADVGALDSADCNGNEVVDAVDIAQQTSADGNGNGFPDECECRATSVCSTSPNAVGAGAVMGLVGSSSVGANDLQLLATGCPPNRTGLFYYGQRNGQRPLGNGFRCVFGRIFRLPFVNTGQQGIALMPVDNTAPAPPGGQIVPGAIFVYQFVYRDELGELNLSDALRVRFCD